LAPKGCAAVSGDEVLQGSAAVGNPPLASTAHDLAAIFFTSGSTGQPKGVMQTHRLILHRVLTDTNQLRLRPDDRLTLLSPPTYSVSLRNLFGALLNGATVCPFNVVEQGVVAIPDWMAREGITVYFSVPSLFREWTRLLGPDSDLRRVRVVQIGGDLVTSDDVERYRRWFSADCIFLNSFASNEAGIVSYFVADKSTPLEPGPLPVGRAVSDKEVLVLGDDGRVLPRGEVGSIAIRSEFLSPGYWRQPALTEAAFHVDPADSSKRVYYTGDLGVLRPDGCLLFKGRAASRAKVRGVTVEVEEVERALVGHPAIEQAVVTVADGGASGPRLIAYIVPRRAAVDMRGRGAPASPLTVDALRTFVREKLPASMAPASYVFLDALPTTPHGKIDRANLPAPGDGRPPLATPYQPPRGRDETQVVAICERVIGVRPIGVDDDFFDLGLDSLGALVVAAQVERKLGRPLRPGLLFAAPTVRQLVSALREQRLTAFTSLVPVQTEGATLPFFWVHGDASTRPLARVLGPEQRMYLLDHQAQDGRLAARTDVSTIAALYLSEMQTVQPTGPYVLGGYSFGGIVALEIAQQLTARGEQVALLALVDPPSLDPRRTRRAGSVRPAFERRSGPSPTVLQDLRRVASLRPAQYWSYLVPRVTDRVSTALPQLRQWSIRRIYRLAIAARRRLPAFTRKTYIFDIYDRARERYTARPYAGSTLFFKAASRAYGNVADWEQILTTCEVHTLDATHREMRSESHVHLWANELRTALRSTLVSS
jgi:acyl-coenzyme A synthetase/AMP-(fatty) acid ligase/thioesterase domain-containing protein/acyl carrier protein